MHVSYNATLIRGVVYAEEYTLCIIEWTSNAWTFLISFAPWYAGLSEIAMPHVRPTSFQMLSVVGPSQDNGFS